MNPTDLTPKQQTSEAIRQAQNILILTGQHPSVDQVAAAVALAGILRRFNKKVTALISDGLPAQSGFMATSELDRSLNGLRDFIIKVDQGKAQADKLRYAMEEGKLNIYITPFKGGFAPSDITYAFGDYQYDIAIILGVPTRARIDKVYQDNVKLFERLPILNLDYHRSNEQYGAVNLIEPTASSLCEMLVALSESLQGGLIDEDIATALLGGIMASTDRFTANHTTSKSLTVAAQLMAAGAKQQTIVKSLYRERSDNRPNQPRPEQPTPAPKPAPQPVQPREEPQVDPATVIPMAAAERAEEQVMENEPIIAPGHIEVEPGADFVPMANFAEAAKVLEQARQLVSEDQPADDRN